MNGIVAPLLALALPVAVAAHARDMVDVAFQPGGSGITINGTIVGDAYIDDVHRAGADHEAACRRAVQDRAASSPATVPGSETSEANNLAMSEDGDGVIRRCLAMDGSGVYQSPI